MYLESLFRKFSFTDAFRGEMKLFNMIDFVVCFFYHILENKLQFSHFQNSLIKYKYFFIWSGVFVTEE